jgi:hypothetical protein
MNPRHIAMGIALVVALGLVIFGDNTPESDVAEAVERAPAAPVTLVAAPAKADAPKSGEATILPLIPRAVLIGESDAAMGGDGSVFGQQDWNPPPPPPSAAQNVPPPPPPPPMAPPLPFTYLGKAAADGQWEVFLARADKTYVVRDKMVIDATYRVDAIAPPNLTLTYLPLNQVQQLNIGVLD